MKTVLSFLTYASRMGFVGLVFRSVLPVLAYWTVVVLSVTATEVATFSELRLQHTLLGWRVLWPRESEAGRLPH